MLSSTWESGDMVTNLSAARIKRLVIAATFGFNLALPSSAVAQERDVRNAVEATAGVD